MYFFTNIYCVIGWIIEIYTEQAVLITEYRVFLYNLFSLTPYQLAVLCTGVLWSLTIHFEAVNFSLANQKLQ